MENKKNSPKKSETPDPKTSVPQKKLLDFAFGRENYILMFAGLIVLFLGFLLMTGGGSKDPEVFSDAIFNTRRMVVAPITLMIGLIIEIVAIMYRPRN